ncbi:MAG: BON domain-containing protein [Gemmatimonadetes bacterium]|nr:BON domain-containing protein [Gemmatimonadota bacterium]
MAEDYEDIYDIESMTDEEVRTLVRERLEDHSSLDADRVNLSVSGGRVTVRGRVGTDAEAKIIEHVLADGIGVEVVNELVVDELVRQQQPGAADEANAQVYLQGQGHGGADRTEDSAEHLLRDTAAEQYGTDDMGEAIERGHSYNPPDTPAG